MSQFDFPRIHFFGKSIIDPATGNNNYHYPLVSYEPISGTAVLPPRIYLDNPDNLEAYKELKDKVGVHIQSDENNLNFIEIDSIDTPELFKSWNITPLGQHDKDRVFHALYNEITTKNETTPLSGKCPGYWNYFGTMNFAFENVTISSIQIYEKNNIQTYSIENDAPDEISSILGAELDFNDLNGKNSAVMIDISPTQSLYTQVFCDRICIKKDDKILMDGQPLKASIRHMNTHRVVNDYSITGASGTFYTTIDLNKIHNAWDSPIIHFFENQGVKKELLKGVFIRYDLFEVFENQTPNYLELGKISNPAICTVLGSINPWYYGEMETATSGRLLLPPSKFKLKTKLGPILANFNPLNKILSLDCITSFPEVKDQVKSTFALFNIGTVTLCLFDKISEVEIGSINIGEPGIDRNDFIKSGGIIDFPLKERDEVINALQTNELRLYLGNFKESRPKQNSELLLKEVQYRIVSDQIGLYAEQGDNPQKGFFSNSAAKEHCKIRVFNRGIPVTDGIEVTVYALRMNAFGCGEKLEIVADQTRLVDGQKFEPETSKSANIFYAFVPIDQAIVSLDIKRYMLETGSFINIRILPVYNYSFFLDQDHSISKSLNFEVIYNEFLIHYDLIYPASGIITPFKEGYFKRIREYLQKLMADDNWNRYLYMPSSRDMPKGKRELLFRWLDNQIESMQKN